MAPLAVQQIETPLKNKETKKAGADESLDKAKKTVVQSLEIAKVMVKANVEVTRKTLKSGQDRALVLVKDPQFRTVTISTASGAVVLGSVGGAFGTASGLVLGTAAGAVPALFTFGLSLPVGAVVGGGAGLCIGTATGASAGAVCGGVAGFGGYRYRVQINNGLVTIQKKALVSHEQAKLAAGRMTERKKANVVLFVDGVKQRGITAGRFAKARAGELATLPQQAMASDKFKVTAAATTAGAVAGGGAGALVGTTAGAALGLIPALFTFGLSIPAGAIVGGCVGTAAGTTAGAAGGGAVGYGGYTYKKEIRSGAETIVSKLKEQTASAKSNINASVTKVSDSIKSFRGSKATA